MAISEFYLGDGIPSSAVKGILPGPMAPILCFASRSRCGVTHSDVPSPSVGGRFTNDDAANQLLHDEYREGWSPEG